jgi:hypothetical protein
MCLTHLNIPATQKPAKANSYHLRSPSYSMRYGSSLNPAADARKDEKTFLRPDFE